MLLAGRIGYLHTVLCEEALREFDKRQFKITTQKMTT